MSSSSGVRAVAPVYRAIAAVALRIGTGKVQAPPDPRRPRKPRASRVRTPAPRRPKRSPSPVRLEQLIEEATVDCYNESEESTGLFTMIEENLDIPFVTTVLGVAVTVAAVDITDDDQIVAICRRGRDVLRVALLDLPMPDPRPGGSEWIDAYRHWAVPR